MSKLVKAAHWIARHFEAGSEPDIGKLMDWALSQSKGELIAGELYMYDDALSEPVTEPTASMVGVGSSSLLVPTNHNGWQVRKYKPDKVGTKQRDN